MGASHIAKCITKGTFMQLLYVNLKKTVNNCLGLFINMLQRLLDEESNIVVVGVILQILLARCSMYGFLPISVND